MCARQERPRVRLTTRAAFDRYLMRHEALAHEAAEGLALQMPEMSCAPLHSDGRGKTRRYLLRLFAFTSAFVLAPILLMQLSGAVLAIWFLLFNSLRQTNTNTNNKQEQPHPHQPNKQQPVYTV